jgi:hypothetical protein
MFFPTYPSQPSTNAPGKRKQKAQHRRNSSAELSKSMRPLDKSAPRFPFLCNPQRSDYCGARMVESTTSSNLKADFNNPDVKVEEVGPADLILSLWIKLDM